MDRENVKRTLALGEIANCQTNYKNIIVERKDQTRKMTVTCILNINDIIIMYIQTQIQTHLFDIFQKKAYNLI